MSTKILVENLPPSVATDSKDLERMFEKFGTIVLAEFVNPGIAVVEFEDADCAKMAAEAMNFRNYGGKLGGKSFILKVSVYKADEVESSANVNVRGGREQRTKPTKEESVERTRGRTLERNFKGGF